MPIDPTLTAQGFCQLLVKSRLVSADDVRMLYRSWRTEAAPRDDDPELFRKYLVSQSTISEYQSQLLFRGNTEGFFLGPYTVTDMIGKGHMAGVYKAVHQSGQVVAIKVLAASKAREPGILARFEREGRLLTSLEHPNIVRAFEVGSEGNKHYFVMEVLEGETLEEVLARRKRLSVPEAISVTSQMLAGLAAIDSRSLIHRDIKPANLMLVPPPGGSLKDSVLGATLKILDIGLGRETPDDRPSAVTELTGENVLLGTPDYLAPEQARDARAADIRADLYSVGCVFYHMLAGRPPFPDTSLMNQMVRHAQEEPKPLKDLVPGIPDGLQRVMDFLLAKDPSRRYATPAKAIQGLRIYLDNVPKAAPRPAPLPEYMEWLTATQPSPALPEAMAMQTMPAKPPSATYPRLPQTLDDVAPIPKAIPAPPATGSRPASALPAVTASKPAPVLPAKAIVPVAVALPADDDEYDVELVSVPPPPPPPRVGAATMPVPVLPKAETPEDEEEESRSLLDPNRRDFIMFGAGAASVLFAILTGYGLASLARDTPEPTAPEPKDGDEPPK